jgi:phospholipid transport system substrate-binding protein
MTFKKILVTSWLLLFSCSCLAADPEPLAMLKDTSKQMLCELDQHIGKLKNNDKLVYNLVNRVLLPHFDLVSMARAVVGRNNWQQASTKTQQQFIKEFTHYVIRTYSSALQSYDGETMKFYPLRGNISSKVRISSDLIIKNGPPIQLQYGLTKQGNDWLIYDFSVDGVSIVKNYNAQFANVLRQRGLEGLVAQLQQNNK